MKALIINDVHKKYHNGVHAVKGISLSIDELSFTAFLGKNGAGKSTLMHMMSTLTEITSGSIKMFDYDVTKDDEKIRSLIGIVFQHSMMDGILTVYDNLSIRGSMYGLSKESLHNRILEVSKTLDIEELLKREYGSLSGGQRRKVDIARALLHQPRILILDEPTTGLDPKSRQELWEYIHQLRVSSSMTILLTTHYLEEVMDADQVIVINEGLMIENASSHALREKYTRTKLYLSGNGPLEQSLIQDSIQYVVHQNRYVIPLSSPFESVEIVSKYQPLIQSFEVIQGTMDDVFFALTSEDQ
ncbi:MAG: ABC transporter ATP-binding protein [Erysipelothrix sp.]|jgi:ABC-type multidrug transport system ATPase subunit|nr:ABC transporter ATP-binding protein [Erysipelothrix sp.]